MIEKLDVIKHTDNLYDRNGFITNVACGDVIISKLNELVDAVNILQESQNTYWTDIAEIKKELQTRSENMQLDAESRPENVQDKFAEQRKWIGCLCRFWFDNKKQADIGILGDIDEDEIHPYFNADLGHNYKCCEPVKPTDSIIYKGSDHE